MNTENPVLPTNPENGGIIPPDGPIPERADPPSEEDLEIILHTAWLGQRLTERLRKELATEDLEAEFIMAFQPWKRSAVEQRKFYEEEQVYWDGIRILILALAQCWSAIRNYVREHKINRPYSELHDNFGDGLFDRALEPMAGGDTRSLTRRIMDSARRDMMSSYEIFELVADHIEAGHPELTQSEKTESVKDPADVGMPF